MTDRVPPVPIRAERFGFRYAESDRAALAEVSFGVEAGHVLLVVGPSGSGKSTLARAIGGLVPGDVPGEVSGSLLVGDEAPVPGSVGIVLQDPASQIVMERVADDVAFGLECLGWSLEPMRRRVPEALAGVGLRGFEERRSGRLSGGEQQRLALAGVLAPERPVLVLDEPTANLDPDGTAAVFDAIRTIVAARSQTVVLVEHRVDEAWALADEVLAIGADGRQIDVGPPDEVLDRSRKKLADEGVWLPDAPRSGRRSTRGPRPARGRAAGSGANANVGGGLDAAGGDGVLAVDGAWYEFEPGMPVLHGVDLRVDRGERVCLVGPNGSGKTTLLRLITGALRPTAGRVALLGDDPRRLRPAAVARRLGYVVQDPELGFMADSVAQELSLGLDPAGRERARSLADRLGLDLDRLGERSPYLLSGGEQRRLSLVVALARRPAVLVLDEPTFGQDRRGWESLVAAIGELVEAGTAVIATTHDQPFVEAVADRVITLDEGWVIGDEAQLRPR